MKASAIALLCMIVISMAMPVLAANDERYSYITINDMTINLDKDQANIKVNYSIDTGTQLIVYLLGKQDLKNKLLKVLNYEDAIVKSVEMNSAEIQVNDISYDYGKGIYWFPEHEFNVLIPNLKVVSPQVTREYRNTKKFSDGMGFFDR
ncbi:MAG: hypothetical protein MUF37_01850 [Methanoregulaceae archaeon]|jgi:hypothetical protein|nr:hypothetical protein [Methanoregulaceae archaeon]